MAAVLANHHQLQNTSAGTIFSSRRTPLAIQKKLVNSPPAPSSKTRSHRSHLAPYPGLPAPKRRPMSVPRVHAQPTSTQQHSCNCQTGECSVKAGYIRSACKARSASTPKVSESAAAAISNESRQVVEHERLHPPSFYCPISHQCMHDPVVLVDGHTYERRHIERWLEKNDTSPVTGAKLSQTGMFPNHSLRNAVEEYFEQVLGDHRQAIKQAINGLQRRSGFSSNATLIHTINSLMQCAVLVNADLSVERVLAKIMEEAKSLVGAEVASVFLVDCKQNELYSTVNSTGSELRIPMGSGVAGAVACSGTPLIIEHAYGDARFNTAVDSKTGFTTRSILCVPIRAWKGCIIGVAQLINKSNTGALVCSSSNACSNPTELVFTLEDQQFLEVLAGQAGAAIVNSGMFENMLSELSSLQRRPSLTPEAFEISSPSRRTSISSPSRRMSICEVVVKTEDWIGASCSAPVVEKEITIEAKTMALVRPMLATAAQNWEMDTLSLAELTENQPLSFLGMYLFEFHGLPAFFKMDCKKLEKFLITIEQGYPVTNQYHNRAHAASVLHFMHSLLHRGGILEASLAAVSTVEGASRQQKLMTMAALVAAIVHDYEHEGVNNDFLVKTSSEKALRYNDRSPNENHHVAAAWAVLQRSDCNFLETLPGEERRLLRRLVVDLVLATDMADHGKLLKRFKELACAADGAAAASASTFAATSAEDALVVLQVALKCADLGHLSLCWSSHLRWVRLLEEEFFAQGDSERKHGMSDISFLMDRNKPGASDSQVGFFDFVVLPLFNSLGSAFPAARPMLSGVEANYVNWKGLQTAA